eukprot:1323771-Amorphochlora_amoeboformis.AAC.2
MHVHKFSHYLFYIFPPVLPLKAASRSGARKGAAAASTALTAITPAQQVKKHKDREQDSNRYSEPATLDCFEKGGK